MSRHTMMPLVLCALCCVHTVNSFSIPLLLRSAQRTAPSRQIWMCRSEAEAGGTSGRGGRKGSRPQSNSGVARKRSGPLGPSPSREAVKLNEDIRSCRAVIELCDLIRTRVHDMNYVNVATAFGTMAKVGSRGRGDPRTAKAKRAAVVALTERALQQLEDFKPQNVANTLWALAKMRVEADKRLLRALSLRATASAADFKPQEVANTLWAFATMGVKADKRLLEA
eukprot:CAMPEP_0181289476 /NCGR_PEP_ID=MMETSP1101-20121128/901_1 /TAXON_ID=46948 /ORGANISM="Rhodomonas abbreviata, Strain Caron Lab Isolate" /LENGTH=224 /DNA_ID=CAMNT_0023393697 /DNA_START=464 /DNA_END=1135 /DNA_ORIENTATION=+